MNQRLELLAAYPFERLARLKAGITPPASLSHIAMSIGEPKHAPPGFVIEALRRELGKLDSYPVTVGLAEMRAACAGWLERRFKVRVLPESMVLPVNGTREALFSFVQAVVSTGGTQSKPVVAMPNPFYQIYEGAALLAGAEPVFLNTTSGNRFQPDLDAVPAEIWKRCEILFLCSPGNPTGAVLSLEFLRHALKLAEKYDFVIASDECYADLYRDESTPPPSLLQAALADGNDSFERCMVFHSLSKRSSVPGLRSGFVAGDARLIKPYSAVSHLPWLRDAGAHATREHRCLERRRPRGGQPHAVSREVRASAANSRSPCSTWWSRMERSTCGPTFTATTKPSRATCTPSRISPSFRAATSRETPERATPAGSESASRWSHRWKNV